MPKVKLPLDYRVAAAVKKEALKDASVVGLSVLQAGDHQSAREVLRITCSVNEPQNPLQNDIWIDLS